MAKQNLNGKKVKMGDNMAKDSYTQIKEKFISLCKEYGVAEPIVIEEAEIGVMSNTTDPPKLLIIKPNLVEDLNDQARHLFGHWVLDYESIKDTTFSSDHCADIIADICKKADGEALQDKIVSDSEVAERAEKAEKLLNRIYGFMQQKQFSVHLLGGLQEIAKEIQQWRDDLKSLKDSRQ